MATVPQRQPEPGRGNAWVTIKEIVAYSRLSLSTVERAIRSGQLQSVKIGRRRLSTLTWVDSWLAGMALLVASILALLVMCALGVDDARYLLQLVHCPHA